MLKSLYNVGEKIIQNNSKVNSQKLFARTISRGNGQRRVIVSGFSGANLQPESHFRSVDCRNMFNYRPVIKGFNPKYINYDYMVTKHMTALPGKGIVRFFPQWQNPKMTRHVVYDIQPPRVAVKGFNMDHSTGVKITGEMPKQPVTLPSGKELIANERVVIQGFSGDSSKPVLKQMDLNNNKPRTVVKGFRV